MIVRTRPLWYIEVLQFHGGWDFLGKDSTSRPASAEMLKEFRDVVKYPHEAQTFKRKMDAEKFALMIAYTNPQRIGLIRVVKYPCGS